MMAEHVPQLIDDVTLVLALPSSTEEWAEDLLEGLAVEIKRADDALHVTYVVAGNCNAIVNAQGFLRDIEEAFAEAGIDPMEFTLTVSALRCSEPNRHGHR